MDIKLTLDKFIEEHVYDRFEPEEEEDSFLMSGWVKEDDDRSYYYGCDVGDRIFSADDMWPREFSGFICLAWKLAEKFLITLEPLIGMDNTILGWRASHMGFRIEDREAPMAICLLVYMMLKDKDK